MPVLRKVDAKLHGAAQQRHSHDQERVQAATEAGQETVMYQDKSNQRSLFQESYLHTLIKMKAKSKMQWMLTLIS
jgi:hypothetical protein